MCQEQRLDRRRRDADLVEPLGQPPRREAGVDQDARVAALDEHPRVSEDPTVQRVARRRRVVRAVAAAAAVVVIGLGIAVVTGRLPWMSPPASGPTVAQVLSASDVRTVSAAVAGGQVRIASSAHLNAAVVTMTDVPPPPAGHVYQLWLTPENGAPRSAGTMGPTSMPPPEGTLVAPLDAATTAGITVETGTGAAQPTGPRVATIPLT